MNWVTGMADKAILGSLKNSEFTRRTAYNALLRLPQSSSIRVVCIFFNSILSNESKDKIDEFIKNDVLLKQFHTKYQMFLVLCQQEHTDPELLLRDYKDVVGTLLSRAGIDIDLNTVDIKNFKVGINAHIENVIKLITDAKSEIEPILTKLQSIPHGGTKRKRRKRRSRRYALRQ
jgi:hypothetical protein